MSTAAGLLVAASTAPDGSTAAQHMLNLGGGGDTVHIPSVGALSARASLAAVRSASMASAITSNISTANTSSSLSANVRGIKNANA